MGTRGQTRHSAGRISAEVSNLAQKSIVGDRVEFQTRSIVTLPLEDENLDKGRYFVIMLDGVDDDLTEIHPLDEDTSATMFAFESGPEHSELHLFPWAEPLSSSLSYGESQKLRLDILNRRKSTVAQLDFEFVVRDFDWFDWGSTASVESEEEQQFSSWFSAFGQPSIDQEGESIFFPHMGSMVNY